jgi:hypothetical protein
LTYVAAFLAIAGFAIAIELLGVLPLATGAIATGRSAGSILRDRSLSDEVKEQAARKATLALATSFLIIVARSVVACAASLVPMVVFDAAGIASVADASSLLTTWPVIGVASTGIMLVYWARGRR